MHVPTEKIAFPMPYKVIPVLGIPMFWKSVQINWDSCFWIMHS